MTIQQVLLALDPPVYATWNPLDKGTTVTLSNSDRTATITPTGTRAAVRATIGKSSGKWYWEVFLSGAVNTPAIGVANSSMPLTNYVGQDSNSWSYFVDGDKMFNDAGAGGAAYGSAYAAGHVVGVALDMDAGTITFYANGVSQGQAFSGLSGTLYPAVSNGGAGTTTEFTAYFSGFNYPIPTGHLPLYS